jgi:hypothetical protein
MKLTVERKPALSRVMAFIGPSLGGLNKILKIGGEL